MINVCGKNISMSYNIKASWTTDPAGDDVHLNECTLIDDDQLSYTHLQEIFHNNVIFVAFYILNYIYI